MELITSTALAWIGVTWVTTGNPTGSWLEMPTRPTPALPYEKVGRRVDLRDSCSSCM